VRQRNQYTAPNMTPRATIGTTTAAAMTPDDTDDSLPDPEVPAVQRLEGVRVLEMFKMNKIQIL
jgi:hypothetical protein